MRYRFVTVDVFTSRRFGGNPLAVVLHAQGMASETMQSIAAEFGYSETTFILPPEQPPHAAKVRIFTPKAEIPFAGHPTVGSALVMAWEGMIEPASEVAPVLEELAGPVPVTLQFEGAEAVRAEFTAPQQPSRGAAPETSTIARALGLDLDDLVVDDMPATASCGSPFLIVELGSREALARARDRGVAELAEHGILIITRDTGMPGVDVRARMYAPQHGIAEDPATGSAAAALAGLLAMSDPNDDADLAWRIAQGVEMDRPSLIEASARKRGGNVEAVRIAGQAVKVMEGTIEV